MNLEALSEPMWEMIRKWDLDTLRLAAKMFEPAEDEDE